MHSHFQLKVHTKAMWSEGKSWLGSATCCVTCSCVGNGTTSVTLNNDLSKYI